VSFFVELISGAVVFEALEASWEDLLAVGDGLGSIATSFLANHKDADCPLGGQAEF
jgi:hypothetical protein